MNKPLYVLSLVVMLLSATATATETSSSIESSQSPQTGPRNEQALIAMLASGSTTQAPP